MYTLEYLRGNVGKNLKCPLASNHRKGDNTPSLSVNIGTDGTMLLRCHANCDFKDIVEACGLNMSDFFPKPITYLPKVKKRVDRTVASTNNRYDYYKLNKEFTHTKVIIRDADGNKTKVYTDTSTQKGGAGFYGNYIPGQPLHLCEGESDTNTMIEYIGESALTAGGVGSYTSFHINQLAQIKEPLFIVFDNDDAGRKGALKLQSELENAGKSSVIKIVSAEYKDIREEFEKTGKVILSNLVDVKKIKKKKPVYIRQLSELEALIKSTLKGVYFDKFTKKIHYKKENDGELIPIMQDEDYLRIQTIIEIENNCIPSPTMLRGALGLISKDNVIDVAHEWISSLEWDGVERVASFWADVGAISDSPDNLTKVSLYTWSALAGRIYDIDKKIGVKADSAPILIGSKGIGKTTFIQSLAPPIDGGHDTVAVLDISEDKADKVRKMRGKVIVNFDELHGLSKAERASLTSYLSLNIDKIVEKYEKEERSEMRRCLFFGTSNTHEIIDSEAMRRRFIPLNFGDKRLNRPDTYTLVQLYAEGLHIYKKLGVQYLDINVTDELSVGYEISNTCVDCVKTALGIITDKIEDEYTALCRSIEGGAHGLSGEKRENAKAEAYKRLESKDVRISFETLQNYILKLFPQHTPITLNVNIYQGFIINNLVGTDWKFAQGVTRVNPHTNTPISLISELYPDERNIKIKSCRKTLIIKYKSIIEKL